MRSFIPEGLQPDSGYERVVQSLYNIYLRKNSDYDDSFDDSLEVYGLTAAAVRLGDKYRRLENLVTKDDQYVKDESLRDTIADLANYAIMTLRWIEQNKDDCDGL